MKAIDPRKSIGASRAAAVCGLSPWSSQLAEYLWFRGQLEDSQNEQMEIGIELEDSIRRLAERRIGIKFEKPEPRAHPEIPFIHASPDGQYGEHIGLECKNVGFRSMDQWGPVGTDEIPDYYLCQVQHQMGVFGYREVFVPALLGGNELRVYQIFRNEKAIHDIFQIETEFWERVQAGIPPAPDFGHSQTRRLLETLFPPTGSLVYLDENALKLAELYKDCKGYARSAECEADKIRGELIQLMGEAGTGFLPSGGKIVRKIIARKGFTVEPTTYQDFRVIAPKERK